MPPKGTRPALPVLPVEIDEVAARVSAQLEAWSPAFTRCISVASGANGTILNLERSSTQVPADDFWPKGMRDGTANREMYWEHRRSNGCDQSVAFLAASLKELVDRGVGLVHRGNPVVDLLVFNCIMMDVADLQPGLRLRDPKSGTTVPALNTHDAIEKVAGLRPEVVAALGLQSGGRQDEVAKKLQAAIKREPPGLYKSTVPHWWLAAMVKSSEPASQSSQNGTGNFLHHLDVNGTAYDKTKLVQYSVGGVVGPGGGPDGVPLWTFDTPEYAFAPHPQLDHKLLMLPFLYDSDGRPTRIVHQADSIRHLRCMKSDDGSTVEATPFETYVTGPMGTGRLIDWRDPDIPNRVDLHAALWAVFARRIPAGAAVTVMNVVSKPELNGRTGKVVRTAADDDAAGRIGVLVDGMGGPIRLKPNCVAIKQCADHARPYSSLEALFKKHTTFDVADKEADLEAFTAISRHQKNAAKRLVDNPSAGLTKVIASMRSGNMAWSMYADPVFRAGMEQALVKPLRGVLWPEAMCKRFDQGLALAKHPKAKLAMMLMKVIQTTKREAVASGELDERSPLSSGWPEQLWKVIGSAVQKIDADPELDDVFDQLQELGYYTNPKNLMQRADE